MNMFLEVIYYDAVYDGIFLIFSHEEMAEYALYPTNPRYVVLECYLIIEESK